MFCCIYVLSFLSQCFPPWLRSAVLGMPAICKYSILFHMKCLLFCMPSMKKRSSSDTIFFSDDYLSTINTRSVADIYQLIAKRYSLLMTITFKKRDSAWHETWAQRKVRWWYGIWQRSSLHAMAKKSPLIIYKNTRSTHFPCVLQKQQHEIKLLVLSCSQHFPVRSPMKSCKIYRSRPVARPKSQGVHFVHRWECI